MHFWHTIKNITLSVYDFVLTKTYGMYAVYFHLNSTKMFHDYDEPLHQFKQSDRAISHSFFHTSFLIIKIVNQAN